MSSEMHARAPSRRQAPRADDPMLTSKLAPPKIPGWVVPRKRIERRIADGARGPLTVITGPPGAGKTIAVASWAATCGLGPVAWVTIDEYDNRQKVFWSYVLAGLRRPASRFPGPLSRRPGLALPTLASFSGSPRPSSRSIRRCSWSLTTFIWSLISGA